MRRLCIGDIHGCYDKLQKVLDISKFSNTDILYSVGDLTDRGNQNVEVLNFCKSLPNFKPVVGNHDFWNYQYLRACCNIKPIDADAFNCWTLRNGGESTYNEEYEQSLEWKREMYGWIKSFPYRINLGDKIIQHTVCPQKYYNGVDVDTITTETLISSGLVLDEIYDSAIWNREVLRGCKDFTLFGYNRPNFMLLFKEIYEKEYKGTPTYFIGHTPLDKPFYDKHLGIVGIDTGSFCTEEKYGKEGALTIVDIDTFEYWQDNGNYGIINLN